MPKFNVTFIQYHSYSVEAEDENAAENEAHKEFMSDMRQSIAQT